MVRVRYRNDDSSRAMRGSLGLKEATMSTIGARAYRCWLMTTDDSGPVDQRNDRAQFLNTPVANAQQKPMVSH